MKGVCRMTIEGDLTPLAPLGLGRLRSGPVRSHRPVYVDLLPPCNAGCPARENIQAWLALIKAGDAESAWPPVDSGQPFSRDPRARSAITRARRLATGRC